MDIKNHCNMCSVLFHKAVVFMAHLQGWLSAESNLKQILPSTAPREQSLCRLNLDVCPPASTHEVFKMRAFGIFGGGGRSGVGRGRQVKERRQGASGPSERKFGGTKDVFVETGGPQRGKFGNG